MLDPTTDAELQDLAEQFALSERCTRAIAALILRSRGRPESPSALPTLSNTAEAPAAGGFGLPRPPVLPRYAFENLLGVGGVAEVWRVYDPELRRRLALKIIHPHLAGDARMRARFLEEARLTAQLQHPGVVPVHTAGVTDDGRPYFTMQVISGHTLREAIRALHLRSSPAQWGTTADGWTLRRLLSAFRQVCLTIAYAHERGVLHRDLKPSNVMLGTFGEVLVLDWGLARVDGEADTAPSLEVRTTDAMRTLVGAIPGTPSYMSPEQRAGDPAQLTPAADVYALGAVLHEILCGHAPYAGRQDAPLAPRPPPLHPRQVSNGVPAPPARASEVAAPGPPIPLDLEALCIQAMQPEPAQRFRSAEALGSEVRAWLDGEHRQEQARALLSVAGFLQKQAHQRRAEAATLRARAAEALAHVEPYEPVERKRGGWAAEDQAEALEREAELGELEYLQTLRAALHQAPDQHEALDQLAAHYAAAHRAAEAARQTRRAAGLEMLLRSYDRGQHAAYLQGTGLLTLHTDPPGAQARLLRFERFERRLVPTATHDLGTTPLDRIVLPAGSYLVELEARGRATVRYPVEIARGQHWDGLPPGADAPLPVRLPVRRGLDPADVYVPAGWTTLGGDPDASEALPAQRCWLDAFVIRRFPVTNADYLLFLNDLLAQGREAEALEYAPRERAGTQGLAGDVIYGRDKAGQFYLVPDADGDIWQPDWPVLKVGWDCAAAYAAWMAARTGLAWRLPAEREWEKAARGVDGRFFPWGDFLDPTFCCMQLSHPPTRRLPAGVTDYPLDTSPYGVRGMAGNARDWCDDRWSPDGTPEGADPERRVCRGGAWWQREVYSRVASRMGVRPFLRDVGISFRLARSVG